MLSPFPNLVAPTPAATPLQLPDSRAVKHIAKLRIACVAVFAGAATGPVTIQVTTDPTTAMHMLRRLHDPKKGPPPVLAAALWVENIRHAYRVAELSAHDLAVKGGEINVSVDAAAKAIAAAAKRLGLMIVDHEILMHRLL